MSIIQQLQEIENRSLRYQQQATLVIYVTHPRAGDNTPSITVRVDCDGDAAYPASVLATLKDMGICASIIRSSGRVNNFAFLPRK
jgi:hypothetical protein